MSVTDAFGGAIAGSGRDGPVYNFQNRLLIGDGDARLRADFSYSSDLGFQTETLAAEADKPGMRYQAGLFWTPGLDFFGQSRIYGVGVSTQTDTRADRDRDAGNLLTLFLPRRSEVDILRDGRLLASRFYEAGNQVLDTGSLPEGAYNLTLRIHEEGGATREMQRFYVKSRSLPPAGQPLYFIEGGILANADPGVLPGTLKGFFSEAGMARRLSDNSAFNATAVGTNRGVLGEIGGTYFSDMAALHAAGVASTNRNFGVLVDGSVTAFAPFYVNIEARKTWGPTVLPINPVGGSQYASFDQVNLTAINQLTGNSTEFGGTLSWIAGAAQLSATGTYLQSPLSPRSYSFGAAINWPFWNSGDLAMTFVANATKSSDGALVYAGLRIQFNGGDNTVIAEGGAQINHAAGERAQTGMAGSLTAVHNASDVLASDLTTSASISRNPVQDNAGIGAQLRGPYGFYTAALDRDLSGQNPDTHYAASFVVGGGATADGAALGGRDTGESGVIVQLRGSARDVAADVLIDGSPRGRIGIGQTVPIFLPPYRAYSVRLVPVGAPPVDFDTGERLISLYPGNVKTLVWNAEPVVSVFGRAMRGDGLPVAGAQIRGARGPGVTDAQGFFQVDISNATSLILHPDDGPECRINLGRPLANNGYAALGNLVCQNQSILQVQIQPEAANPAAAH